jgi:hypothetical protein
VTTSKVLTSEEPETGKLFFMICLLPDKISTGELQKVWLQTDEEHSINYYLERL